MFPPYKELTGRNCLFSIVTRITLENHIINLKSRSINALRLYIAATKYVERYLLQPFDIEFAGAKYRQ